MEMDEIYKKIYKNEAEKESDQIELQMFDVENNEMGEVQKIHSIATDRHIQAMLNNYKYSFSLDYERELEELKEMEEWQIEATFGLYDITDPKQWEEYLEYEIKWIKHIEKFSIEWMTSLDRPLIFRDLLSFFGQDWDLEGFQKMKQYYKEESDYCFTKFMEYAEILGYLDRDTTKSNIENIFDEKQEELDDDDSGDIGFRRLR